MKKLKVLKQDNEKFYPITYANAVIYNDSDVDKTLDSFNDKIQNLNNQFKNLTNQFKDSKNSIQNELEILNNKGIKQNNFGGIVCLTLGSSLTTDQISKIIPILSDVINNKKHYIVTIYDTVLNKFFGDCEVIQGTDKDVNIIVNYSSTTLSLYTIYYSFKINSNSYTRNVYSISVASKGSVDDLIKRVTALENQLQSPQQ